MELPTIFSNMLNKVGTPKQEKKPLSEKDPLRVRFSSNSITERIEIKFYRLRYQQALPEITYNEKEVKIAYKGIIKKVSFSKPITDYFLDSINEFSYIILTLYKHKKIVPLSQIQEDPYHRKKWEDQLMDLQLKNLKRKELDFI